MESTDNVSWMWPFKGGTRRERLSALKYLAFVGVVVAVVCLLSLALTPYF